MLERPVARLMISNLNLHVSWKPGESTRMRTEESLPKYLEDNIVGKGRHFTATLQFGTQIYSYALRNEDTRSKGSSG